MSKFESFLKTVLKEEVGSSQFVYVLIDGTQFDFWVYGIYSDPQIANRALKSLQREEGEAGSRFELKKVPLNEEPGPNYIPDL